MRHIKKKIYLEEFKSRVPSMVNAYSYNGGNPMMFSENSLISGNTMQQCNYGLYPLNLMVPINGEEVELSWRTIVKRYNM